MEFTFMNIVLILALIAISMLLGGKIGYRKGRIHGLLKGKESEREYIFSKIPKEECKKIVEEEYNKVMNILYGDNDE